MPYFPFIDLLSRALQIEEGDPPEKVRQKIHVSSTISRMAFLYEKIRVAIDYKDEHLLRKNAIERILTRRLSQGKIETFDVRTLVVELVRAGYLKNDTVPESVVEKIKIIFKAFKG